MPSRSIKVPQPQFSDWVIKRRHERGLSTYGFSIALQGKLSERTLKYLEDHVRDSFSEETIKILAESFQLTFVELLDIIENLGENPVAI